MRPLAPLICASVRTRSRRLVFDPSASKTLSFGESGLAPVPTGPRLPRLALELSQTVCQNTFLMMGDLAKAPDGKAPVAAALMNRGMTLRW